MINSMSLAHRRMEYTQMPSTRIDPLSSRDAKLVSHPKSRLIYHDYKRWCSTGTLSHSYIIPSSVYLRKEALGLYYIGLLAFIKHPLHPLNNCGLIPRFSVQSNPIGYANTN